VSRLRIVADRNIRAVESYFGELASVRYIDGRGLKRVDLLDTDVLLVRSVTRVNEALLAGSSVRFVGTATSGYDHIDQAWLANNQIGFAHAPGSNANSVVEYVLAAIANSVQKLEQLLAGGELGIVGYGHIGRALTARCEALGLSYKVYDPWLAPATIANAASLDQVLACEVVSFHAALTRQQPWPSYHLLGAKQLAQLSPDTLLINAGRGELIDCAALLELRQKGGGPMTVLDVWEGEPAIDSSLLALVETGSAHIAGYSLDGKYLATKMLRDNVCKHFKLDCPGGASGCEPPASMTVPPDLRDAALLRWALGARYDIREDDRLLRAATLGIDAEKSPAGFDLLRKSYRQRRELLGSQVRLLPGNSEQRQWLEALGVIVSNNIESGQ
jgi:erythronate-4-phosphate dehydrogenase